MSIILDKKLSLTEACLAWLAESRQLAENTRKNYRGEIDRLGQYLAAKFGLLHVSDIRQEHWTGYVGSFGQVRQEVTTRRQEVLSASSSVQAFRITRQFLMWCATEGLIDWIPNRAVTTDQSHERRQDAAQELPIEVSRALLGQVDLADIAIARSVLVINLAYWGALTADELSKLKVNDLSLVSSPRLRLAYEGRMVRLPDHLGDLWRRYRQLRQRATGVPVHKNAPLVSHLRAEKSVQPWSIWAMIKQWQKRYQITQYASPRSLRMRFIHSVAQEQSANLAAVLFQVGKATYSVRASATEELARIRQVQIQARHQLEAL